MINTIKNKAIANCDKKIRFAAVKNPEDACLFLHTENIQAWDSPVDQYCRTYHTISNKCGECPLSREEGCCGGLVDNVGKAKTWGEWIKVVEELKEFIEENG